MFTAAGYHGGSIREIARRANVDPSLVLHYFGSKSGLLNAAVDWPFDIDSARRQLLSGEHDEVGVRLAALFLDVWDAAGSAHPVLLLMRVAGTEPQAASLLQRLLRERLLAPLWPALVDRYGVAAARDVPEVRSGLIASQLVGLAMIRYVLGLEPLASMPPVQLAAAVGPVLQRYLSAASVVG